MTHGTMLLTQPSEAYFGDREKESNEDVARAFRQRLVRVAGFKRVPAPLPMRNTKGAIVYYLFFASQTEVAGNIITDIFMKYRKKRSALMSLTSHIEWTDATWNPVRGCTKISPGCKHCYAETFAERFRGVKGHPYEQGFDLRLVPENLTEPFVWRSPKLVFVDSMSDLFQDDVSGEYTEAVSQVMDTANRHTYQVLTKRSERLRDFFVEQQVTVRRGARKHFVGG